MSKVEGIKEYCNRCLATERWGGKVVLMVVDASFTSSGLNYFTAVVPKVVEFENKFVKNSKINSLKDLAKYDIEKLKSIWRFERSWNVAIDVARYLSSLNEDDKISIRNWARNSKLDNWKNDPIGKIKGVGLVTYQYLRMMGGVDTCMPDKIVKRVLNEIFEKAGYERVEDDFEFIKRVEEISKLTGYRPIELTWMTWLIQSEGDKIRMDKYREILKRI
ncbi:MAG: hypothetical protein RXR31_02620 [Thermoproteota archaeon]|jgi:hypothetical protein